MRRDGLQIGRYRILQLLGTGGMGDAYLATSHGAAGFEKPVVVKMLRPQGRHVLDLLREAFIGVTLEHANVVQVFDLGEHDGRYYIVMEYVRGFSLAHVLDDAWGAGARLPLGTIVHVVGQVAEALDYVHSLGQGIIHRDVSPSNVLVGVDGRIKLSDFGVATLGSAPGGEAVAGKPVYLPPECFRGAAAEQSWDVYALGHVLWEALAGRRPFAAGTVQEARTAVLAGPPPLEPADDAYPPAVVEVAERAIHPDPARRYRTAAELEQALRAACPPGTVDVAAHRRFIRDCFASPRFVARFGSAPDTRELLGWREQTPTPMPEAVAPTMDASRTPIRVGLSQAGGAGWARGEGERLAARLQAALGRPAVPVVLADYRSLVDGLGAGVLDLAWMPPAAFVEAERSGARALAIARRMGATSYRSAIIAHRNAGVFALGQLRGEPLAWVDRDSASGYLFAIAELIAVLGHDGLGRQHFVGSHRAVCEAVAECWATAGATYAVLDDATGAIQTSGWHERLGAEADQITVLGYSPPIPGDNIACRPGLDEDTRTGLAEALVGLAADDEGRGILHDLFHAEALVPVTGDIYGDVRAAVARLRDLTG